MARLAIAKDFLAEYAKLQKNVQSAVESAIGKFAEHTEAGVHLEKLQHSRDRHVRTIRIDNFWRGVVVAPEPGDTYCLITVLPHDKANAYAASHRFSVNQVLGVMEVRDQAALEQLQPGLRTAPAEKLLFAHVSEADLKRLGVDEQIIPLVRLIATEAHLEALERVLPDVQYTALYALACGMTVEEAWSEVVQYLPTLTPPEQIDPGDLVSAMERTPGQVAFVTGQNELQDILAHPFAAWRFFLHPSQRKIAYETSYKGPVQVTGGAGTGKTVTAIHRAAYLARRQPDQRPASRHGQAGPPILLTTFTRNLAHVLGDQLALLIQDDAVRDRVEVLNVDRLAYRIVAQARGSNPAVADNQQLHQRWASAAADAAVRFTPVFLEHEWEQVILAQDLHSEQAYLTCLRSGRGSPLSKAQRSQVWKIIERVVGELRAARQSTHIQLANEATQILRQSLRAPYRHVIVDEAQDLHPAQWRLLRAAVKEGHDDLFIVSDPHQRIYDSRVSLASLGIGVRGRSRRLRINYRTTQEILAWAVPLLGTAPSIGLDGEADSLAGYRSPMHGRRPQIRGACDREEELKILSERLREWIADGIEPHAIGVTARSAYLAKQARDVLEGAGIPAVSLTANGKKDAVRAGTMHGMKGLEFRAVAVIGVEEGTVPAPAAVTPADADPLTHEQDLQRERCVLFVACTRARDHLHVSYTGKPSPFLSTG